MNEKGTSTVWPGIARKTQRALRRTRSTQGRRGGADQESRPLIHTGVAHIIHLRVAQKLSVALAHFLTVATTQLINHEEGVATDVEALAYLTLYLRPGARIRAEGRVRRPAVSGRGWSAPMALARRR